MIDAAIARFAVARLPLPDLEIGPTSPERVNRTLGPC